MKHAEFIAAIQLGTHRITGIAGRRDPLDGSFSIIAYDMIEASGCIRRGNIRNVTEAGAKIKALKAKLEQKMAGSRIGKIFVGLGGQSLHSEEISITRSFENKECITDRLLDELNDESRTQRFEDRTILDVLTPVYYLDGQMENNPQGIHCSTIEAKYQLILARNTLQDYAFDAVKAAGFKDGLAGIIISPLALADTVLGDNEKEMGCALIDFGYGTTSVSVYRKGSLLGLSIIPLGGNLITKDIATLFGISESAAEKIKREYGSALVDDNNESAIPVIPTDNSSSRTTIPLKEFYRVIAARQQEIIENALARIKEITGNNKEDDFLRSFLRSGIFITGNAAALPKLDKAIQDRMKAEVHFISSIRRDIHLAGAQTTPTPDFTSLGLLLQGYRNYINCAVEPPIIKNPVTITPPAENTPPPTPVTPEKTPEETPPVKPPNDPPPTTKNKGKDKSKGKGGFFGNIFDTLANKVENTLDNLE
jgi:cell division protein FtsA